MKPELSLILPCYNESEHLERSVPLILKVLQSIDLSYEVIFVEDASTDNTKSLLRKLLKATKNKHLKALYHAKNMGRGKAVSDGIEASEGIYVGYMDIDCEVSPKYIPEFVTKLKEEYDVVCGKRLYKTTTAGLLRSVASTVYSFLARSMLGMTTPDSEAGYKFFNRKKILPVLKTVQDHGWFWDTEIIVRSERSGLRVTSLPVRFNRRQDKTSTVHLVGDTLDYLRKLLLFIKNVT